MENEKNLKPANYKWWKDKKMRGTIILIVSICFLIFTFVKVAVISTMTGYTIGMLFGFYAPLFYFFIIYKSLISIFGEKIKLPKWIKLTDITYWFVVVSVLFISASSGFYQSKNGFTSFGLKPWNSFGNWFDSFTGSDSAWTPNNTNGGVIGVFLYSLSAMVFSGIGALILSIMTLITSASIMITGTSIGLYKDIINKKKLGLKDKEIQSDVGSDLKQFEVEDDIQEEVNNKNSNTLPFDDPF